MKPSIDRHRCLPTLVHLLLVTVRLLDPLYGLEGLH